MGKNGDNGENGKNEGKWGKWGKMGKNWISEKMGLRGNIGNKHMIFLTKIL